MPVPGTEVDEAPPVGESIITDVYGGDEIK
jgi:hypothetical protein